MPNWVPSSKQWPRWWPICSLMSTCLRLNRLYFLTPIASLLHPLSVSNPSSKCCAVYCWMVAPTHWITHCITIQSRDFTYCSIKYGLTDILAWGSDSRCLGEIWQYQSPSRQGWSVLSGNSVNINQTYMSNMDFLCILTIAIPWLASLIRMA